MRSTLDFFSNACRFNPEPLSDLYRSPRKRGQLSQAAITTDVIQHAARPSRVWPPRSFYCPAPPAAVDRPRRPPGRWWAGRLEALCHLTATRLQSIQITAVRYEAHHAEALFPPRRGLGVLNWNMHPTQRSASKNKPVAAPKTEVILESPPACNGLRRSFWALCLHKTLYAPNSPWQRTSKATKVIA